MNHALMDTAEIGNVIAKYINVQHLVGALVEGGSFRGGDLWLGENPNGSFGAYGKRWNAGIDSNGRIYGSGVYFESGTFQGNVLANSGTMNNVTIRENCQILGNLSAAQITGDIVRVYDASNQAQINLGSSAYGRDIAFSMIANSGRDTTTVTAWVNGVAVRQFQARITDVAGTISSNTVTGSHTMYLPAGQNHVVQFTWSGSGGNNSASCTIIVSKH